MNTSNSKPTKLSLLVLGLASFGLANVSNANQSLLPIRQETVSIPSGILPPQQLDRQTGLGNNAQRSGFPNHEIQFGQERGFTARQEGGREFPGEKEGNLRANFQNGPQQRGLPQLRERPQVGFGQGRQQQWRQGASKGRQEGKEGFVPRRFQQGQFPGGQQREFRASEQLGHQRGEEFRGSAERDLISQKTGDFAGSTGFHAHTKIVGGTEHRKGDQKQEKQFPAKPQIGGYAH